MGMFSSNDAADLRAMLKTYIFISIVIIGILLLAVSEEL